MVSRVRLGLGVAMLAVAAGLYFKFGYLLSLHSIKVNRDWIAAEVEKNFWLSACIYMFAMCLDIGLTIPGATTLSFAGGLFFDQPYAAIFSYMGYVIGACVSYLLVRTVLADFAKWLLNTESRTYKKLERNLKNNAFVYLIAARYTLVFPFWFVNGCAALIGVPFNTFMSATAVAVIPGSVLYTTAGRAMTNVLATLDQNTKVSATDVLIQSMGSDDVKAAAVSLAACAIIPVMMKIRSHRKKVAKSHNAAAGTHDDEKKDA
ncbi:conserved hypothetical protein [Perkinsus marinus ATCC 50983]|uniref:VTT domain-containing protein n=1 Tax=Perkinsus marinus (strain ATCC 50983 / TXsc) TaxID=423536 RepID=C5KHS4_PERM5|nr:conserved hypothetical protein [Perkinsus marinus ATCC 50983]EER16136.1 conserved hypothetical protein [Perkinsus marinus ATCC 50983]|eukprot:XP_002784340.1 conserved hypothetical protein [Perkinsus marinus ATCC 50983]